MERIKALFQSIPISMTVIFIALLLGVVLFPRYMAVLPTAFLIDALFLLILIFKSSQLHLLAIILVCFFVAVTLRRYLPEQSKNLSGCWIIICTMLVFAYGDLFYMNTSLYTPLPYNFDIPILLCALPAWCGSGVGKWMKRENFRVISSYNLFAAQNAKRNKALAARPMV